MSALLEFEALKEFSARIGRNPLLTQGSSGNTSIKIGSILWIKASGTWLADAEDEEVFLPLNLDMVRHCFRENLEFCPTADDPAWANLRPSVETAMHAVLRQAIVAHVHSVNAIAAAVRSDAQTFLGKQLVDLPWAWVPYVASGRPLAEQIAAVQAQNEGARIFILGNHGLVVCGDSCREAESLLLQVEKRLEVAPRHVPNTDEGYLQQIASRSAWALPRSTQVHALGTDPIAHSVLSMGVIYPCQQIFLHGSRPWQVCDQTALEWHAEHPEGLAWPFLVLKGRGVLVRKDISDAEYETLAGLAEVVLRLKSCCSVRYLTSAESAMTGGLYRQTAQPSRSKIRIDVSA